MKIIKFVQEYPVLTIVGLCLIYGLFVSFSQTIFYIFLIAVCVSIIWLLGGGFKWIKTKLLK